MLESNMQMMFNNWKKHNYKITCAEELKIVKNNRFSFSNIESHEITNLYNTKHDIFQFKIPDLGSQNPFDSFSLYKVPSWIVVMFYKPRKPKIFYMIDIDVIIDQMKTKKSITEAEACALASHSGVLK